MDSNSFNKAHIYNSNSTIIKNQMIQNNPLVTIGIPTYQRASLLKRSIESALNQDYTNIELIISDNGSTDGTEHICKYYASQDSRIKYIRHSSNLGPNVNFFGILDNASGQFFTWLGDDDWIDVSYVSNCVQNLIYDPTLALVIGCPRYYRKGQKVKDGKIFSLLSETWWQRVLTYYIKVSDNSMFCGVMRTPQLRQIGNSKTVGGDRLMMAKIVSIGKAKVIREISLHREMDGMSASVKEMVNTGGLPTIQAIFPFFTIAVSAWMDIVAKRGTFQSRPEFVRWVVGCLVFFIIILKSIDRYLVFVIKLYRRFVNRWFRN